MIISHLTPFLLFTNSSLFDQFYLTRKPIVLILSSILLILILLEYFYFYYIVYFMFFILIYSLCNIKKLNRMSAFKLSIYSSFALSELYEIPIHIISWISLDLFFIGLAFSFFRGLSIIFFIYEYKKQIHNGLKYQKYFIILLILYGLIALIKSIPYWAIFINAYRFIWIAYFIYLILMLNGSKK